MVKYLILLNKYFLFNFIKLQKDDNLQYINEKINSIYQASKNQE